MKSAVIKRLNTKVQLQAYIQKRYDDNIDTFVKDISQSLNKILRTDLNKAADFVKSTLACFHLLPKKYFPRYLSMEARVYHWQGKYKIALGRYHQAEDLYKKARDYEQRARMGNGLMDVHMYLGNYKDALRIGKRSLTYFKRKGWPVETAQVINNIGNIYHRMDNNQMALRYYNMACKILKKDGGARLAVIEYNRANIYANMDRLKTAESLYKTAATLYGQANLKIPETRVVYSLAYLYFLQDKFTEALKYLDMAHDRFMELGDKKSAAVALLDLAEINIKINQYGTAASLADKIIPEFKRLGMCYEQAKAYYFAALARIKLNECRKAGMQLKAAMKLFISEKNFFWRGMVYLAESNLSSIQNRHGEAITAAERAMRLFAGHGHKRHAIDAKISLIEAVMQSQDPLRAIKMAQPLLHRKLISYQKYRLSFIVGLSYYQMEEYRQALANFKTAACNVEKMISGLYPDEIRFFFIADKYDVYKMVVDTLLHLNRTDRAFIDNLKALRILNYSHSAYVRMNRKMSNNLIQKRNQLRASLKKLHQLPKDKHQAARGLTPYRLTEQKLWNLERKIRLSLYPEITGHGRDILDERTIESVLQKNEILVNFVVNNNGVGFFHTTPEGVKYKECSITADEMNLTVRKLHFLFENAIYNMRDEKLIRKPVLQLLNRLYEGLWEPLNDNISGKSIILLADGEFGQIPFLSLLDGNGHFVKDSYQVQIIANPEDLYRRRQRIKFGKKSKAVFAVSSNMLPAIELEAAGIGAIYSDTRIYFNESCTRETLIRELGSANGFVHIATHASRVSENPLFSRILLNDGPFFPFDLFGTGIKAPLVTLSGCQTAAPGLYYGNSFSLAKAFHQAGSRFVLASLWPVSDKLSMIFMIEFYRQLSYDKTMHEAYYGAVEKLSDIIDSPVFWGSFVLLGI